MTTRRVLLALALASLSHTGPILAQGADKYPSRPIRVILPLSAGSTTDIVARMFAERLGQRLHQSVVVENKPGAGGTIAAQVAAKAAPDGYTLLLVNSQHAINPSAYEKLPYDTARDFEGVALVCDSPSSVTVPTEVGVRTLQEFIALAKRRPSQIAYASSGVGSQTHLSGAYFASRADISMLHVPYKSTSEVMTDLVTSRIQAVFAPVAFQMPHIQAGKLRVLAVTGKERLSILPDVPTVSEAAIPGFEFTTWFGFVAPAKVPEQIKALLARELKAVAEEPEIRKKLAEQGMTARVLTLGDFDAYIASEIQRLAPVVKASGVKEKF
jgi:tripartite-type tricarboxylate transporter receptor subunit TctC